MSISSSFKPFTGVKVVLLCDDQIIAIQRDEKPGLRFSGMWDLPGGGREGNETPFETAQREVFEELNLTISEDAAFYQKEYPAMVEEQEIAYFLAAHVTDDQIAAIIFGDEGQGWKLTTIDDFIQDKTIVPFLRGRLQDFLEYHQRQTFDIIRT